MADLEEHAFKRDRRFVVRLVLALALAALAGIFVYGRLTSAQTAGCAADALLGVEAPGFGREHIDKAPGFGREHINTAPSSGRKQATGSASAQDHQPRK